MKTKLLRKVKKTLKSFNIRVIEVSEKENKSSITSHLFVNEIKVIATETYRGKDWCTYTNEEWFYSVEIFERWKKEIYFKFYKSCIKYYKNKYNLKSGRDKKMLKKYGLI